MSAAPAAVSVDGMPEATARVGLVTVTYNSGGVIDDFLRSVLSQDHRNFILYLVDNASSDDTLARARLHPDGRIRVLESGENVGFAAGCNLGMRAALAEGCSHVLLINNDTVFDSHLICALLSAEAQLAADIVVPKILRHGEAGRVWSAGGGFDRLRGYASFHIGEDEVDSGQYERPRRVEFAPGCCMLLSRNAIGRLGYFDERYFVYTEDADYCWRARALGMTLWYTPAASLLHKVSSLTGGGSPFSVRYTTRNRVLFLRKNLPAYAAFGWLLALQLLMLGKLLLGAENWSHYLIRQRAFREGLRIGL
jgi:GT2 family glycosyltransferase